MSPNDLRLTCFILFFIVYLFMPNPSFSNETRAGSTIDINSAPLEELIQIIHIGETRALELISLRPFSSLDDLVRIKGIGQSRIEDIKEQGLAWVWSNALTPGAQNKIEQTTQEIASSDKPKEENKPVELTPVQTMSLITEKHELVSDSLIILFKALIISVFSGISVLVLRRKLISRDN